MLFRALLLSIVLLSISISSSYCQDKIGHFAIEVQSGAIKPLGKGNESLGMVNGLSFKYFATDNFSMGLSIKHINNSFLGLANEKIATLSQIPLSLDFDWYIGHGRLQPFVGVGLGLHFLSISPKVGSGLKNTAKDIQDRFSSTSYVVAPKGGFMFVLNDNFSACLAGTLYSLNEPGDPSVWVQPNSVGFSQNETKVGITLSLLYHFAE